PDELFCHSDGPNGAANCPRISRFGGCASATDGNCMTENGVDTNCPCNVPGAAKWATLDGLENLGRQAMEGQANVFSAPPRTPRSYWPAWMAYLLRGAAEPGVRFQQTLYETNLLSTRQGTWSGGSP